MIACFFQQAKQQIVVADEEVSLLSSLQGQVLEIQIRQQEILPFLQQPQALQRGISDFKSDLANTETLLDRAQEFSQTTFQGKLQALLAKHNSAIAGYLEQLRSLIQQILPLTSQPEGAIKAERLILNCSQSQDALKFYQFAHELTDFAKTLQKRQEKAHIAQNQAALIQAQIIIGSMVLSARPARSAAPVRPRPPPRAWWPRQPGVQATAPRGAGRGPRSRKRRHRTARTGGWPRGG